MKQSVPLASVDYSIQHDQGEVIRRLVQLSRPSFPMFYSCGIIAARLGYYQLAELKPGGDLIALYALNLHDLQRIEYPVAGTLLRMPESLFGVNVYKRDTSGGQILADMMKHQEDLRQVIAEEGTLVRTGANVFQSRTASYAISGAAPGAATEGGAAEKVHVDMFHAVIPGKDYVPVYHGLGLGRQQMQYPRTRLTIDGPVDRSEALFLILKQHAAIQTAIAGGNDITLDAAPFANPARRLFSRLKIGSTRYVHRLAASAKNMVASTREGLEKMDAGTVIPLWRLVMTVRNLPLTATSAVLSALSDNMVDGTMALLGGARSVRQSVPEALAPFVQSRRVDTPLTRYLPPLDVSKFGEGEANETGAGFPPHLSNYPRPLSLEQSRICPSNANVRNFDPFDTAKCSHVGWNSIRTALGTILLIYPNTSFYVQANGLWIAACHDRNVTYVGYNLKMDKSGASQPAPHVAGWLKPGYVIRFRHAGRHQEKYATDLVPLASAMADLKEITDTSDRYLLTAEKPELAPLPLVVNGNPSAFRLDYHGALTGARLSAAASPRIA